MAATLLTSKENPLARKIRLVASGARRAPVDLVLAEGTRVLEEATASGHKFEALLLSEEFGSDDREKGLLEQWRSRGIKFYRAAGSVLRSLSEVLSPQGAVALVRVPVVSLGSFLEPANPLIVCAAGIQDPGNLGAVIRTARATGASLVCTTAGTVAPRNPKCIRSSAGAFFRIPSVENVRPAEFLTYCFDRGIQPLRTDPRSGTPVSEMNFRVPSAVVLGNEARGLDTEEWNNVPAVRIPMLAGTESLNVAAAAAIVLYEAFRQRTQ